MDTAGVPSARPHAAIHTSSPVLVGRETELRTLSLAAARPPSVGFVAGEAGIGKTRLVRELAIACRTKSTPLATAACQPLGEPFPYGPVLEILRSCGTRLRDAQANPVLGALRPHLPELADRLPAELAPLPDPAAERHRLFRAVRDLLAELPRLVMVVEDVHWADQGTRELLRFILTDPPRGLSTVITYRPTDLPDATAPLGRAFHPASDTTSSHITLSPLDFGQVHRLTEAILGGEPVTSACAFAVHQCTAGIPFVVEEALNAWGDPREALRPLQNLDGQSWGDLEVPAVLKHAVLERLAGLPRTAVALAEAAAVAAVPAGSDLLAAVAGIGIARARTALVRLLKAGALVESSPGHYGFRHMLAQRAVYDSLPGPRREELHRRAARELERRRPCPLVRLAQHCRLAGETTAWLRYTERAADQAAANSGVSTAVELLRAVLVDPSVPAVDLNRFAGKFYRLALSGIHQHEATAALEQLVADPRLTSEVRGEVRLGLGMLRVRQSEGLTATRGLLEQAVTDLAARPDLVHRGMSVLAAPYLGIAPAAETRRWLCDVEDAIDRGEPGVTRTSLLANALSARVYLGDTSRPRRLDLLPRSTADTEEQRHLARAHTNLADAFSWVGPHDTARRYLDSGLTIVGECGAPFLVGAAKATRLRLDWMAGDWSELETRAGEMYEVYRGLDPVTSELSLVLAWLATARGEWTPAQEHLEHTGIRAPEDAYFPVVVAAFGCATALWLECGEPERALRSAEHGVRLVRDKGVWTWTAELAVPAVDAYLAAGRHDDADRLVDDLSHGIAGLHAPLAAVARDHCLGLLATGGTREKRLEAVREQYERLGLVYRAAQVAERVLGCETGSEAQSDHDTLTDLIARYERCGATRDAARCRHRLREAGGTSRSRRGRRGYGAALSPRESEVARLIAGGHTNEEIAQVLFLSRRTVEQHVSQVLRKSGVASRHQLRR